MPPRRDERDMDAWVANPTPTRPGARCIDFRRKQGSPPCECPRRRSRSPHKMAPTGPGPSSDPAMWMALQYRKDNISPCLAATIRARMPHRLACLDAPAVRAGPGGGGENRGEPVRAQRGGLAPAPGRRPCAGSRPTRGRSLPRRGPAGRRAWPETGRRRRPGRRWRARGPPRRARRGRRPARRRQLGRAPRHASKRRRAPA